MIATIVLSVAATTASGASIGVAPYVSCEAPGHIGVVVANVTSSEVKVSLSSLPWHIPSNVIRLRAFVSAPDGTVRELKRTDPIADYWGYATIGPNSTLAGGFSVSSRFGGFREAVATGAVTVFYDVVDPSGKFSGGSGVIFFPRSTWFSRACPSMIRSAPGFLNVALPSLREKAPRVRTP